VIQVEFQPPLSDRFLYTLAVGCVAGRTGASFTLVDEAADLIRRAPRILLTGAKTVHFLLPFGNSPLDRDRDRSAARFSVVSDDDGGSRG